MQSVRLHLSFSLLDSAWPDILNILFIIAYMVQTMVCEKVMKLGNRVNGIYLHSFFKSFQQRQQLST